MGTGYTFHCNNCGHDDIAMLGVGMLYPSVCDETLAAVRAGEYGEKLQRAAESAKHVGCAAERKIYVCEDCGSWAVLNDASLYGWADENKDVEIDYVVLWGGDGEKYRLIEKFVPTCGKCGGDMHAIDVDEDSDDAPQLSCNECGSPLTAKLASICWD